MDQWELAYECGWQDALDGFPSNYWVEQDFDHQAAYDAWAAGYLDCKESYRQAQPEIED